MTQHNMNVLWKYGVHNSYFAEIQGPMYNAIQVVQILLSTYI